MKGLMFALNQPIRPKWSLKALFWKAKKNEKSLQGALKFCTNQAE